MDAKILRRTARSPYAANDPKIRRRDAQIMGKGLNPPRNCQRMISRFTPRVDSDSSDEAKTSSVRALSAAMLMIGV